MDNNYWDGCGLPGIGQKVINIGYGGIETCVEIIAHGFRTDPESGDRIGVAIFQAPDGCGGGEEKDFKRDLVQAKNHERQLAVAEMLLLDPYDRNMPTGMMSRTDFCRALFDAGYLKSSKRPA